MRILLVNKVAAAVRGGLNKYVLDIAHRMLDAGEEVALVHEREPKSEFRGTGYVFNGLSHTRAMNEEMSTRLEAIIDDFNPDVVQLHDVDNVAMHAQFLKHAPTIRFVHNHHPYCSGGDMTLKLPRNICTRQHTKACLAAHYFNQCGSWNPVKNLVEYGIVSQKLQSFNELDGILVASPVIRENLIRNGVDEHKINLLPIYAPPPRAKKRKIIQARRMILHPGGLVPNKGIWFLVDGVKKLPDDVELVFAGGGSLMERLQARVKARGLNERVRIMGDVTPHELSELYNQCEIVLFPSRWNEPVGLPGVQAMAHGKPVLAFDSGGVRGWLDDGKNGRMIKFNDGREFIRSINELLDDPEGGKTMGREGYKMWKAGYQPQTHMLCLQAYYDQVIARRNIRIVNRES